MISAEKTEVKVFGLAASTNELFNLIGTEKGERFKKILKNAKGFVGAHQTPDGVLQIFLFMTPGGRGLAYEKFCRCGIRSAFIVGGELSVDVAEINRAYARKEEDRVV